MPKTGHANKLRMSGLEQVRALSHPVRLRLLELFAEQPRTTMQAAERLGEVPTRLYHHVAALERAGLVRLRETRPNRGATEKYYEAVANRFEAAGVGALSKKSTQRTHAAMGFVVFDQARKELVQALASKASHPKDTLMAVRGVLRLSPAAAKRLSRELQDVVARVRKERAKPHRGHRRYSLTIALLPTDELGGES